MAGFRMHISTSTVLGIGYAGVLYAGYGVPAETAVVSGAMCGFSGMLPDIDSDYGVPLRETMAFSAATIPMLLVGWFQSFELSHDAMALAAVSVYLLVRFGITNMIRKYTVHRGMFHSIPAMLIFTGMAFLIAGASPIDIRCYKAGGVLGGFMSHLVLDEIYAVEWKGGRWRLKKSFGTAIKFWGDDAWSNFSTYAKLAVVVMLILGEPSVMHKLEANSPQFANQVNEMKNRFGSIGPQSGGPLASLQNGFDAARNAVSQFGTAAPGGNPNPANSGGFPAYATPAKEGGVANSANNQPTEWQWPVANQSYNGQGQPATYENAYDTAQRPNSPFAQ